jgi:flagellar protein FliO/FliZ
MSALSGLAENRALMVAAGAVALFVAALLILLVFRLAFGRRLRMSGGRGRQLRLGIVDAFDLDRQRQLVIVRRDNVEHLIMIGGPNDVLIESEIVRAEARDLRETRGRDKDGRDKEIRDREFKEPPQMPPLKAPEPKLPPPLIPEPLQPAARELISPARLQPVSRTPPVPPTLPPATPPRRMPRPDISPLQPEPPRRAQSEPSSAAAPPLPPATKPAPNTPPRFLRPARSEETPPKPPNPAPAPTPYPSAASEPPDAMESLEEEMAKLLGRSPNKH